MAEAKTVHTVLSFTIILEGPQMPILKEALPKYRKHKASGQAVVTIQGQDFYLGPWNTKASRVEYDRVIAEYLAAGRQLPAKGGEAADLTLVEILARYKKYAKAYYRKNGKSTGEWENVEYAIKPLLRLYGHTPIRDFGPLALKAVRQKMIESGLTRQGVNARINRIKRVLRWAVSEELAPALLVQALATVAGLEAGRTSAPETAPVTPVADDVIEKTLPHLPAVVADMVRFQRLVGCRPGEVCVIRPCDVDRTGDVWRYVPESHKCEHHNKQRIIFVGPRAQAILLPYLLRDAETRCFTPIDSERKRMAAMRANRKTKVQPSQVNRAKPNSKRKAGGLYTTGGYAYAIRRACDKANIEPWSPNRLRHTAATVLRSKYGIEASRTVLGHASPDTTLIYAERDLKLAASVMQEVG
jgi:integrase